MLLDDHDVISSFVPRVEDITQGVAEVAKLTLAARLQRNYSLNELSGLHF
jgi:hypothetical protein